MTSGGDSMSEELFEKGEPRSNLIVGLAIVTIVSLSLAAWGFTSMFNSVTARVDSEVINGQVLGGELTLSQDPLQERRAWAQAQTAQLTAGRLSIDNAMQLYGRRGRNAAAITAARASEDEVPGWDRLEDPVGGAAAAAEETQVEAQASDTARENAANAANTLDNGLAPAINAELQAADEAPSEELPSAPAEAAAEAPTAAAQAPAEAAE